MVPLVTFHTLACAWVRLVRCATAETHRPGEVVLSTEIVDYGQPEISITDSHGAKHVNKTSQMEKTIVI